MELIDFSVLISLYYWITWAIVMYCGMSLPIKLHPFENVIGTCLCAFLGFVLWIPFFIAYRITKNKQPKVR